jgi:hypothetical protein
MHARLGGKFSPQLTALSALIRASPTTISLVKVVGSAAQRCRRGSLGPRKPSVAYLHSSFRAF